MENQELISKEQVFEAIKKGHTDGAVAMFRYIAQEKLWVGALVNHVLWCNRDNCIGPPENVPNDGWSGYDDSLGRYFHIPKELTLEYRREIIEYIASGVLCISLKTTEEGAIEIYYQDECVEDRIWELLDWVHYAFGCCQDSWEYGPASRKVCEMVYEAQNSRHKLEEFSSDESDDYIYGDYQGDDLPYYDDPSYGDEFGSGFERELHCEEDCEEINCTDQVLFLDD